MNEDMNAFAAGVVLEDGECVGEEAVGLLAVGEVCVDDGCGPATGADSVKGGRWGLGVAENEEEMGPRLREGEGDCCADACVFRWLSVTRVAWREVRREGGVAPSLRTSGCARDEGDLIREGKEVEDG